MIRTLEQPADCMSDLAALDCADAALNGRHLAPPVWSSLISNEQWDIYGAAIHALQQAGVPSMIGGAFGLAAYTGRCRNTKDLDLFLRPRDRETAIQALTEIGCADYFEKLAYDRGWIYRSIRHDTIVDLIWGTPNRRAEVTEDWLEHAPELDLRDRRVKVIPPEELLFIKLFVLQRDRTDWPDLINLLYATSAELDWDRLIRYLDADLPLLTGLLSVFAWVCPNCIADIPVALRKRAGISKPRRAVTGPDLRRIRLLDSRPWFAALQPCDRTMEI
jgi:hypothetical protein